MTGFNIFTKVPMRPIINNKNETIWKVYPTRPDEPSLSCYMDENGKWRCIQDTDLDSSDPDDSY